MSALQESTRRRQLRREADRARTRAALREALDRHLPKGTRVWIYGSLTRAGRFHEYSDIDLAVEDPRDQLRPFQLMTRISAATGREADVCRMEETRLAERIRRDGELWTL